MNDASPFFIFPPFSFYCMRGFQLISLFSTKARKIISHLVHRRHNLHTF